MKNGPLFLIGIFAALSISWGAIVLGTGAQLGSLTPYYDDTEGNSFPLRRSGIAAQGAQVYADLGCAACHTQQVRRPGFGADQARGWGDRQSVARDYIFETRPQLGSLRVGPDLTNLAARKPSPPDAQDLMKLLYAGSETHPGYRFLFDTRKIVGERSNQALSLPRDLAPPAGYEVVPSNRAEALVTYLLSLQNGYEYPEARPAAPEKTAEENKNEQKK
jgi:cytochrome c oxidase cbb3-type subunit 2